MTGPIVDYLKICVPIDPNPAIAACGVFPQSGRSHPEKGLFFRIFLEGKYIWGISCI